MRCASFLVVGVTVCCSSPNAVADGWTPDLTVGLQFGGQPHRENDVRFIASFDVRSQTLRRDPERTGTQNSAVTGVAAPTLGVRLNLLEFGANRKGIDLARVLGHDMLTSGDRLNDTGDASTGSSHWVWWTAGALAATAAVALTAGGHHGDSGNNTQNSAGDCVGVNGGTSPSVDNSGCPSGVPSVHGG